MIECFSAIDLLPGRCGPLRTHIDIANDGGRSIFRRSYHRQKRESSAREVSGASFAVWFPRSLVAKLFAHSRRERFSAAPSPLPLPAFCFILGKRSVHCRLLSVVSSFLFEFPVAACLITFPVPFAFCCSQFVDTIAAGATLKSFQRQPRPTFTTLTQPPWMVQGRVSVKRLRHSLYRHNYVLTPLREAQRA